VGIVLLANVLLWTGYLITRGRIEPPFPVCAGPLSAVGALLVAAGAAGTFYCRLQMRGLWNARTVLAAGHRVIDSGPYRLLRHPIYSFAPVWPPSLPLPPYASLQGEGTRVAEGGGGPIPAPRPPSFDDGAHCRGAAPAPRRGNQTVPPAPLPMA